MITRFECPNLRSMVMLMLLHLRIKRSVARLCPGNVGAAMVLLWPQRTILSISLWRDIDSVYDMGKVQRHILAARLPHRLGVRTRCGVFCYAGDWRRAMFGGDVPPESPLYPISTTHTEATEGEGHA